MASESELTDLPSSRDRDRWPWSCLGCDVAIYHDGTYCRDCRSLPRRDSERVQPGAFEAWFRSVPYPMFVLKVTAVGGIELALTGFWLRLMRFGPSGLAEFPILG